MIKKTKIIIKQIFKLILKNKISIKKLKNNKVENLYIKKKNIERNINKNMKMFNTTKIILKLIFNQILKSKIKIKKLNNNRVRNLKTKNNKIKL